MQIFWEPILLVPLVAMVIPIAILVGQRLRGGPLISLSAGAALGILIYLALIWASLWSSAAPYPSSLPSVLALACGSVLLLGGFALAVADSLRVRRREWVVGLCLAIYATFVGLIGPLIIPIRSCQYLLIGSPICTAPDTGRFLLFSALSLLGPCVMLIYALRVEGDAEPETSSFPDGLTISRLDAEEI